MLDVANTTMSLILSLLSGWAILSSRVRDGIIIKTGLSCLSVGFLGIFFLYFEPGGAQAFGAAYALVDVGLLICAVGYLLRIRNRHRGSHRRASDWIKP